MAFSTTSGGLVESPGFQHSKRALYFQAGAVLWPLAFPLAPEEELE